MAKEYIPKEGKKKGKNWWAIIFLFFLVIGLSSSFVFFGFGSETKVKYNGKTFNFRGDHWEAKVNGQIAAFTYPPEQVSTLSMPEQIGPLLLGKVQIDATSNQNDSLKDAIALSEYQLGLTLSNYNSYLRVGFDGNSARFPTIACRQATPFVPVIYFKSSNATRATLEDNCVIVEAKDGQDMLLIKDRLLYAILGIA